MTSLYNFLLGNIKRNPSSFYDSGEADQVDDLVENGFVLIKSENEQKARFIQDKDAQQENICRQQYEIDTLCLTGAQTHGDTSRCSTSHQPIPCSSVADIPMQKSGLLTAIESCRTLPVSQHKFLDLELFDYDFKVEISVLNNLDFKSEESK